MLPLGQLDALDRLIKATLNAYVQLPPDERDALAGRVNDVVVSQASLRAAVTALGAARTTLMDAAGVINEIDLSTVSTTAQLVLGGFAPRTSRTATVKITAQDLITKATSTIATVTVNWGGTKWEVSTGAVFSRLPSRKFENAQIIENGKPQLDAAGKINTRVTETLTRPMIVPIVLAHYRLAEGVPASQGQRIALLATAGAGVNPYSASADIVFGPTFSYRGLMISALAHRTRDLRLTNGLQRNQELGSSPPTLSTERFWTTSFAVGVTYRVAN